MFVPKFKDMQSLKAEYSKTNRKSYVYVDELLVGTFKDGKFSGYEGEYPDCECADEKELFIHLIKHS